MPRKEGYPDLHEIEELVVDICKDVCIAYGDFDYFVQIGERLNSDLNRRLVIISIWCEFSDLEINIKKMKEALCEYAKQKALRIRISPCYREIFTKGLLDKEENE